MMPSEFVWKRMVQFAETDMAGVMHFANYLRWMEECEHAFWRSLGRSVIHVDGGATISWPRGSVSCEYSAPIRFEQQIELHLSIKRVSDRTVTYEIDFRRDGRQVARGTTTAVCCTMTEDGFRAVPIPGEVRESLRVFTGAELRKTSASTAD